MPSAKVPSLSDLQQWMRWVLTHPKGVGSALTRPHALKNCLTVIGETPDVNRETRLSIYGNGYFWRIIEAIGTTFSSVSNTVGADAFYDVARAYLVKYPSRFKSIDDIGADLSEFLKGHALSKKFPFLSDLTALEWAAHQSFFADDAAVLDPKKLKQISARDWSTAKIKLDASVHLLKSSWPVGDMWREDGNWRKQRLSRLVKSPHFFLIYRHPVDKFVRIPLISPVQYQLLSSLSQRKTLGQTLAKLPQTAKTLKEIGSLQSWFGEWAENGVIQNILFR